MTQQENEEKQLPDISGYKEFEEMYGLPVEQYLSTLSLATILHIMEELNVSFTDTTTEELLEEYQYQVIVETIDAEICKDISLLDNAIKRVKERYGLVQSAFKKLVIDVHKKLPTIETESITLEPLSYATLYDLEQVRRSDTYVKYVNRGTLTTMSHTAFIAELQWQFLTSRDIQFVVRYKGEVMGTIFSYDYSPYDGRAMFSIYLSDKMPSGYGIKTTALFVRFLFEKHNLKTLSTEVYDDNTSVVNMWRKLGVKETGYMKYWRQREDETFVGLYRFTLTDDTASNIWNRYI